MEMQRIGIIGGNGWIGGGIARGLVAAGLFRPEEIALSCRGAPPGWLPGAFWTHDNQSLADRCGILLLSVRPADWPSITVTAPGRLVISVMAGVRLADIAARLGTGRVVRALPNAAVEVGRSYTPWVAAAGVAEADRVVVRRLVSGFGTGDEVASEAAIDYMTGLSGTGPAYPALLASALLTDAVAHGLPVEVARRAVVALLVGTGRLFEREGADPEATVAAFAEYRGVTAAALEAMQAAGFGEAVSAGLSAALEKSLGVSQAGGT